MMMKSAGANHDTVITSLNSNLLFVASVTTVWAIYLWFSHIPGPLLNAIIAVAVVMHGLSFLNYSGYKTLAAVLFVSLSNIALFYIDGGFFTRLMTGIAYVYIINLFYAFAFYTQGKRALYFYTLLLTSATFLLVNFTFYTPHLLLAAGPITDNPPALVLFGVTSAFFTFRTLTLLYEMAQMMFEKRIEQSSFEVFMQNLNEAIFIVGKNSKLIHFNEAFKTLCGAQFNIVPYTGMPFPPEAQTLPLTEKYKHLLNKAFTGESYNEDVSFDKAGVPQYLELSFHPFFYINGEVDRLGVICRDVTSKKMLDLDMIYTRNNMIEMIAHDLKAPLSIIKGVNSSSMGDTESQEFIDRTCRQSISSIDELLSFFKYLSTNDKVAYAKENISEIVISKAESYRPVCLKKGQELVITGGDKEICCNVNKDAISRVIGNLIDNAVKFSPNPGKIQIHITKSLREAVIKVSDEGIGISDNMQKKLFARFSSAQPDSSGYTSTGLGLFLVSSIIKIHSGHITLKSELKVGTTFTVTLPLAEDSY